MSVRSHRDKSQGKKIRFRRMPPPDQVNLGTRVHKSKRQEDIIDEDDMAVLRCIKCGKICTLSELNKYDLCEGCENV